MYLIQLLFVKTYSNISNGNGNYILELSILEELRCEGNKTGKASYKMFKYLSLTLKYEINSDGLTSFLLTYLSQKFLDLCQMDFHTPLLLLLYLLHKSE